MLTPKQKLTVIKILDTALGFGTKKKDENYAYFCPFCNHHKKKLEIDIISQSFHCWVCHAKGKKISSLLYKLDVSKSDIKIVKDIYGDKYTSYKPSEEDKVVLQLPKEFKSLQVTPKGLNPLYLHVKHYVKKRGISEHDILKHNIGYCEDGMYSGRVIIPSYDKNGELNYFIARTIYPDVSFTYKNPPVSKNIIAFENQINWNEAITICEGIFDAIAIKRNVIPIFGKFIPRLLMNAIFEYGVKEINIMLDDDAQKQALYYTNYFNKQGIITKNIISKSKDASDMGFSKVNRLIKETKRTEYGDIITQKLNNI